MEETEDMGLGIRIKSVYDSEDLHPNNQDPDPEDKMHHEYSASKNDENSNIFKPDEKSIVSTAINTVVRENPPSIVVKFEPIWMIKKIYEWDQFLGGQIKQEEKLKKLFDPFFAESEKIKSIFSEIKKLQNSRNNVKKVHGNSIQCVNLTRDLDQSFETAESYITAQHDIIRSQSAEHQYTQRELTQKEDVNVKFRNILKSLKDKEFKSMYIKQLNTERGIMEYQLENFDGFKQEDYDKEGEGRELSLQEKEALEKWKKEDAELDGVFDQIDGAMDQLMVGIDEIGDGLQEQAGLIENVDDKVDDLTQNLSKTASKLKKTLNNFRKASSVAVDIVSTIILTVLIGVLIYTLKKIYW